MNNSPKTVKLADYRPFSHDLLEVSLAFDLYETHVLVTARCHYKAKKTAKEMWLDGEKLELQSILINGAPWSDYQIDAEGMKLTGLPKAFELTLVTQIYPKENKALEGLYQSGSLFCTQCEAQGFRKITYFPDRPDVMTLFRTHITADLAQYPVLLSNGNRIGQGSLEGGRHWALWEDPFKKPCYLFALVAGDLVARQDRFITKSGRVIALELWTEPETAHKTAHGMESLKKAMAWDERVYGLEYDLDIFMIVAVKDFNMGAMENKGLNIFNSSCVLANQKTSTDGEFEWIMGVIGHEYFHNWSGNRITCRDWFQLSLKEGLTIFRDQHFSADMTSKAVKRIEEVKLIKTSQFAEDGGPMAHPVRPESYVEINNFYTLTVYHKGSELIRMASLILGKSGYFKGAKLYFERHDGQACTIEDWLKALEDGSGADLSRFKDWYFQAGTPELSLKVDWDETKGEARLHWQQTNPPTPDSKKKQPLLIPILLKAFGQKGQALIYQALGEKRQGEWLYLMDGKKTELVLEGLSERPLLSVLRGFSAPVRLQYEPTQADRLVLMAHDDDGVGAFEAAQGLLTTEILAGINQPTSPSPALIEALRALITHPDRDPALIAHSAALPSETLLLESMTTMEVEGIFASRKALQKALGLALEKEWKRLYQTFEGDPYQFNNLQNGRRALKNLALSYLVATGQETYIGLAQAQIDQADNMTDRLAAISILTHQPGPAKEQELAEFYRSFKNDDLVVNKYFGLIAGSPEYGVEAVGQLLNHPAFDRKNPNRLRAVVGGFTQRNLPQFHKADGSGYRFLADQVLLTDPDNPQIASRLVLSLARWRRFPTESRPHAEAELKRILKQPGLSKDVLEIVSKSLG